MEPAGFHAGTPTHHLGRASKNQPWAAGICAMRSDGLHIVVMIMAGQNDVHFRDLKNTKPPRSKTGVVETGYSLQVLLRQRKNNT